MAERIRFRKGTYVIDMQDKLRLPYACVAALPLPKGDGYALLDEHSRDKMLRDIGSSDLRRIFLSKLSDKVPRGAYSLDKPKRLYRLKKVS